jgi:transcriptional regulator with PAS, ATPase and Fis domain
MSEVATGPDIALNWDVLVAKQISRISNESMDALKRYLPWPGNIRESQNLNYRRCHCRPSS